MIVPFLADAYRRRLVRFFIFRLLKEVMLTACRNVRLVHSFLRDIPQSGIYSVRALSSFSNEFFVEKIIMEAEALIVVPAPNFNGYCAEVAIKNNTEIEIRSPALEVFVLSDSMVVGSVDFVFNHGLAIHHDLFEPLEHHCPAENVGVICMRRAKAEVGLYLTQSSRRVKRAVSMVGQCSSNYAHWLTETLPKLVMLDAYDKYADFPLLVDDDLHPNIYASLDLFNKNRREIIKVRRWEAMLVDVLVVVSNPGYERYTPHDIYSREAAAYVNRFSHTAFCMLRAAVDDSLVGVPSIEKKAVYFARSRTSRNIRQIENLSEIEQAIATDHISMVASDSMSFVEQVQVCMTAKILISPIGAALANMIFCPPGCKVIVLSPYYDDASYFYYSNLCGVLGHELFYVLGPQTDTRRHPIHRNYRIDVNDLKKTLLQVKASA